MPKPIELHTSRLLLRPVQVIDAETLFGFGSDEEFARFSVRGSRLVSQYHLAEGSGSLRTVEFLMAYIKETNWEDRPHFAIIWDRRLIGEVYINLYYSDLTGELGYAISRNHWGKGLALEAAQAVVDYGFEVFSLAKIFATVDPRNVGSVQVLKKLGMKQEGLLRSHIVRPGERADKMYFGLLREEWEELK